MTSKRDLETVLRGALDPDTLAVYADLLLAAGDIRGEIISAQLQRLGRQADCHLDEHIQSLVRTWLGEVSSDIVTCTLGFVEITISSPDHISVIDSLWSHVDSSHVRSLRIRLDERYVASAIQAIAGMRHDSLVHFELEPMPSGLPDWPDLAAPPALVRRSRSYLLSEPITETIARSFPNLLTVHIRGSHVLTRFEHPTLKRLQLHGYSAVRSLGTFPCVEHLRLDIDSGHYTAEGLPPVSMIASALDRNHFPALRDLDLSGNADRALLAYRLLRLSEARARLFAVRLPVLKSEEQLSELETAAHAMPQLRLVTISGNVLRSSPRLRPEVTLRIEPIE